MKQAFMFWVCLVFANLVQAAEADAPELDSRIGHYYATYTINPDATHVETHEWTTKVLHERALESVKNYSVSYSTSIEKAEILHAYTVKADGRKIEVPKSNYQLSVNSGKDKNAPVFSDYTTLTVVFPDLAVGDTIDIAYKITQTEAMFPGQISFVNSFSRIYAYDDVRITVDFPALLKAQYQARQMQEQRTEKDGRVKLVWTYENKNPAKSTRKDWSVYDTDSEPGFAFSTFKSYAEIAQAYGVRASSKAVVTESIKELANTITKDKKSPREQARALYEWVATNITYAGNCIGVGAVVPHDLSFILDNRMGDCKDHATLLQSLLSAKGIASTQALVNAGSMYRLPKIPVVSSVNHVINYLPELNLFLDSTSPTTPFGWLPFGDAGKPVLLVDGFKEGMKTPVPAIGANQQHLKIDIKIDQHGAAHGEFQANLKGMLAINARAGLRNYPKTKLDESIENMFRGMGLVGKGKATMEDPKPLLDTFQYKITFELKDLVQLPGPAALFIHPILRTEAPVQNVAGMAIIPIEKEDVTCHGEISVEEYTYHFPKNMKVISIPDNTKVSNEIASYQATYQLKGNTLKVKRALEDKTPGVLCSPATMESYKKFAIQATKNLKAQVIYK